jgi:PmbA protein
VSELLELAERVAGWARDGEQLEAYALRSRDTDVEIFEGKVESLSAADSAGMGIRVVAGRRQGFAYGGSLDPAMVSDVLAEARDNAQFSSEDEWACVASPDGVEPAALDLWDPELPAMSTDAKVSWALELERAVRGGDPRIRQVQSAAWSDSVVEVAIATNTGIAASSRRTVCWLSATAVAGDGEATQTASGYSVGRGPSGIELSKAAGDAVRRATRLLGAVKPRSEHLTVVLEPRVTATLLAVIGGTLDGDSVLKGRSLFAGRVGEEVAAHSVTLVDDPTDPLAFGAGALDAEGLASRRNVIIEQGVLRGFLYDTYTARRAGTASTGSAVRAGFKSVPGPGARALTLIGPAGPAGGGSPSGGGSPGDVLALVGDGLLVQSVSGVHSGVNPVSGDFSVGAEGLLISGGELGQPVREVTIGSTLQRMLAGVVAIGNDIEYVPSSAAGVTIAIADVAMSGM